MNTANLQAVSLASSSSFAVHEGQRAWAKIKATAAEQRELWRLVGEALLQGRRQHPSNQAFGKWCKEMGFDMAAPVRSDAMWFAECYRDGKTQWPVGISDPKNLRQWYRENHQAAAPSPEVALNETDRPRPRMSIRTAQKINKLAAMATQGTDGEAETARKYLKKAAEKLGLTSEEAVELAAKTDAMHGASASDSERKAAVEAMRSSLADAAKVLKQAQYRHGFSREAAVALFDLICDGLQIQ